MSRPGAGTAAVRQRADIIAALTPNDVKAMTDADHWTETAGTPEGAAPRKPMEG
jgi:hypothetical protein